ncbi:arginine--tRNA ligase [Mycoplasma iguanae]|uniref:Arginine--tRNA ligase n=1 Tax=Mycoplasma iguanae TaxID=292461 RepID=A0ABY5RBL6_9MOLU|nr:arginine--tRNA ligase [Mycoplasma iguanae]UVD81610.1 arginine--tRNA ligase [Mycoplasma iguanae]
MDLKQQIAESLEEVLKKWNIQKKIIIDEKTNFGDFASSLALTLTKDLNLPPLEIAKKIVEEIDFKKYNIKKIDIVAPGFINFFVNDNLLVDEVNNIIVKDKTFGSANSGLKINIEFVSANPTGFLHVAHARGAVLGSILSNILTFRGNHVIREYYINDAGNQIDRLGISAFVRYQQIWNSDYPMPEDSYQGQDIVWLAQKLKEKWNDQYLNKDYQSVKEIFKSESVKILLTRIKEDLSLLNVTMDKYFSESDIYNSGAIEKTLKKLKGTFKKDGALWLNTMDYGDDKDRVLIKQNGDITYLLPDIAYHNEKFLFNNPDKLIDIWGADHSGYIKRMQIALQQLGYDVENKFKVLVCQTVRLIKDGKEFKMSKRKGNTVFLRELINLVGKNAVRFFTADRSENSGIDFDLNLIAQNNTNNPVYLLQYTHARAVQLLNKSQKTTFKAESFKNEYAIKLINNLKTFPNLLGNIEKTYKTHLLPQYLIKLAKDFNAFYSNSDKIIGSEDEENLLAIVKATQLVLSTGLELMGIDAPERMAAKN